MKVYEKIAAVQAALAKVGIAKHKPVGSGVNYAFRGIDAVYSTLSPLLAEHGLVIIPRVISRECTDRQSKNGGALFYVAVHVEFDFVAAEDGSKHTAATYGEAMDSSDKATNKAMSAAYKYAAFMTFAIPTEGDNDADATVHEVAPREPQPERQRITDDQRDELKALIDAQQFNIAEVCQAMGIKTLKEIWQDKFEDAKAFIHKFKPQQEAV